MEFVSHASILPSSTAPLKLTPKSPRTPSAPTPFSSQASYGSPTSILSIPPAPLELKAFSPRRAPTPPLPKRMKSTPILRHKLSASCEIHDTSTAAREENPIVAPKSASRQSRVVRFSGRLGGLALSTRKGKPTNISAESPGIPSSTTLFRTPSKTKRAMSTREPITEDDAQSPDAGSRAVSPGASKRKWLFASSSFWPSKLQTSSASSESSSSSPCEPFPESAISSDDSVLSIEAKAPPAPLRGILKNKEIPPHQRNPSGPLLGRSVSCNNTPSPPPPISAPPPLKGSSYLNIEPLRPTLTVTLPDRKRRFLEISDDQEYGKGEWERSLSELFEGLFILSSGGRSASSVSLATIKDHLDVPEIVVQQEELEIDIDDADTASRGSSSFETPGEMLEHLGSSWTPPPQPSSATPSFDDHETNAGLHVPSSHFSDEDHVGGTLHAKRSSSALPSIDTAVVDVPQVKPVTSLPSPPCSPEDESSPSIQGSLEDPSVEEHAIQLFNADGRHTSVLSDDQWTLRAESTIAEKPTDEMFRGHLPRYSQLSPSPAHAAFNNNSKAVTIPEITVEDSSRSHGSTGEVASPIQAALPRPTPPGLSVPYIPPTRLASLPLPPARPTRRLSRADLACTERDSQQWDREKVTRDVRQVVQRLRWDKAQKAWHLVREAEHAPIALSQVVPEPQVSAPPQNVRFALPPTVERMGMLPPGRMEWALVDSAAPSNTGQPGLLYRICVAWHVTPEHNALRHPFGAQEEIKVFVLGRTLEEFYQFYLGLMGRFMLEPRRHPWTQPHEMGPKAMGCLEPMDLPFDESELDFTSTGAQWELVRDRVRRKVDALEGWMQGLMRLKETNLAHVLESDYVRMWLAPRREGDCERRVDSWRKDGHGELRCDSEGIARVLERLW